MSLEHNLPTVPAKHSDFLEYVKAHPGKSIVELVRPYNDYDAVARKIFAQEPDYLAITNNHLNLVPLFDANGLADVRIRARDLASESEDVKSKYLMPLKDEQRRANGAPAVVSTLGEFRTHFGIFSESSLSDLDWNNVVAAGSAVATCILPVPDEYSDSKRGLRQFYHEEFAPASDVDLFLYGLTEEQAIEKIKQIEKCIRGSILTEVSTIRTKHAITIVSQHPTRHVQIVLRRYKSIAEVLTGFDVDCSCVAYDGSQVYLAPRAVGAYITQINHIDLSRRSPSYENRLSKYSHRGFEVFWPDLDRSRIDPSVFERSFRRTVGLARLLVLEKLPKSHDRERYLEQRRRERGRPPSESHYRFKTLRGNIKNDWEDEIAEWAEQDDVSDYHTFTIPYGPKFYARKIEKLLYTKDLLLNAEWNKPKDREVNLHRHPAFFGSVEDVINDCCGYCPKPSTPEEEEVAAEESKIYISGNISFLSDNPGRQEIGSFNPITDTDWTEMAYIGNSAGLCQAIVDNDLKEVQRLLGEGTVDVNRRDHTGRTPLHLACMTSTPAVVQHLVNNGARLIWRMADGRTALHLAAARGSVEIVRILLTKSGENEEEEARKEEARKRRSRGANKDGQRSDEDSDGELVSHPSDDEGADAQSFATGSFVKVKKEDDEHSTVPDDAGDLGPDIYDINALAWDTKSSPLHLAILNGHVAVAEELVSSFGANVLLPIKLANSYNNSPRAAILTLVLAHQLPENTQKAMTEKLLEIGASPAQADINNKTALHYLAHSGNPELLDIYQRIDRPAVDRAINHLCTTGTTYDFNVESPLMSAIVARDEVKISKLLELGANPAIHVEDYLKAAEAARISGHGRGRSGNETQYFEQNVTQPVILAVENDMPAVALELLARGADPNTLTPDGYIVIHNSYARSRKPGSSLLDYVRKKLEVLREYEGESITTRKPLPLDPDDETYLEGLGEGTYQMWAAKVMLQEAREKFAVDQDNYLKAIESSKKPDGLPEKKKAIGALLAGYEKLVLDLLSKGAKTFQSLHPGIKYQSSSPSYGGSSAEQQPYKTAFYFRVRNCTEEMRQGYLQLFEAAWSGDIETIKSLTLGACAPNKERRPLEIGVTDHRDFSAFSLAILRGHLDAASAIIAIAMAQYMPVDRGQTTRYRMQDDADSDNDSYDSDANSENFHIKSHVVDAEYTTENVGEAPKEVESKISPLSVLHVPSTIHLFVDQSKLSEGERIGGLIQYAIWKDDIELLNHLIDLGQELVAMKKYEFHSSVYTVSHDQFLKAIRLGRIRCLEVLIKRTGAGLPLDKLAEKSGVEIKEKPKYYQGLSVHGKKRADWAAAGGGIPVTRAMDMSPPLLHAAKEGNLAAVEWFLGTAPGRYYLEFAKAHKKDGRLKKLALTEKGLERSILDWLSSRRDLVLHCAVISEETEESRRLVEYLVEHMPHCMEVKSVDDYTPLGIAFRTDKLEFAKTLIKAGANQAVRATEGMNLLHLLLRCYNGVRRKPRFRDMLSLIDPLLIPSMLVERCSAQPGSLTPLAYWMSWGWNHVNRASKSQALDVMNAILDLAEPTGQKHLELLDGSGNTPLHAAVNSLQRMPLKLFLERRPDLLYRENAVGSTPADLAESKWTAKVTSDPPRNPAIPRRGAYQIMNLKACSAVDTPPRDFVKKPSKVFKEEDIHRLCIEKGSEGPNGKRKLVSVFDANEVAKRLALSKRAGWGGYRRRGYEGEDGGKSDEVTQWLR